MKTKISMLLLFASISLLKAQVINTGFYMGADSVQVYDYGRKIVDRGIFLDDTFEDNYNLKITNKVYKVRLNFPSHMKEEVQKLTSKILDDTNSSNGFKTMEWKKNKGVRNEMYQVRIAKGKLRFKVIRANMDQASYALLTAVGQTFLRTIKQ